ncbi:hypothetical protein GCM10010972_10220 [Cellulomonas carbonis]|nr:hypothetical protein GCM10010972_10220 [Cellulomonas carbonis]
MRSGCSHVRSLVGSRGRGRFLGEHGAEARYVEPTQREEHRAERERDATAEPEARARRDPSRESCAATRGVDEDGSRPPVLIHRALRPSAEECATAARARSCQGVPARPLLAGTRAHGVVVGRRREAASCGGA